MMIIGYGYNSGWICKNSLIRFCDAAARCTNEVTQPNDITGNIS
jgi:hypothetical protein